MMKNFNEIEAYLNGRMTEEEVRLFEAKIAANKTLAKEVATQQFEQETLLLAEEDELRRRIKHIQASSRKENTKQRTEGRTIALKKWWIPLSIAASLLLLLTVYFFETKQYSNESLAASYYDYTFSNIRKSDNSKSVFSKTNIFIEDGKYEAAIKSLTPIVQNDTFSVQANLLLGHVYFKQQEFTQASLQFKKVSAQEEQAGFFLQEAQWNWLLSELEQGNMDDDFYSVLNQLIEEKYPKAAQLKLDLDSIWR